MEVIGIICEYNPFHNGHLYHINKIKKMYPDSIIILVLNGYFLERGELSILTKEDKTKIALDYGIDIVLELPFIFGTQSADTFGEAAVSILNNFHITKLVFGSETDDIIAIKKLAQMQLNPTYDASVKKYLDQGLNYPTALAKALNVDFDFTPNDLLGIAYTKAIIKNNFKIEAITIKRTSDYHDTQSNAEIISAKNIREKLKDNIDITTYVPDGVPNLIKMPNEDKLFTLLKYKINTTSDLDTYLDVDEGIENRLLEFINKTSSLSEFISNIKTKRYTYNKINRMLIHILVTFKKEDNQKNILYTKILGFNKKGKTYLNSIKDTIVIPTIIDKTTKMYRYELKASLVYDLINGTNTYTYELKNKPIIKD